MKKSFLLAFIIMLFIRVDQASANVDYQNGWFDNNPDKFTISDPKAIDNDVTTYASITSKNHLTVTFNEGIAIDILTLYVDATNYTHFYDFYNSSGVKIHEQSFSLNATGNKKASVVLNLSDVKQIVVRRLSINVTRLNEIEIFERLPRNTVKNLVAENTTHSSTVLSWDLPSDDDVKGTVIKLNGEVLKIFEGTTKSYTATGLTYNDTQVFDVSVLYEDGTISNPKTVTIKTKNVPTLKNVKVTPKSYSAVLNWDNPSSDQKNIRIYQDGKKLIDISKERTTYELKNLEANTRYNFSMSYVFEGIESEQVPISFITKEVAKEVKNLTATPKANEIALKWDMPSYESLDFARIYRKADTSTVASLMAAGEQFKAIFETNGTSFKDLTVEADQQYTYKVTTVDENGGESEGAQVTVKTNKVSVSGIGGGENDNGDYIAKWTQPTTGQIKVIVDGKEFKTVSAADKQVTIPKSIMKYDIFGNPKVEFIPIDPLTGKEGAPSSVGDSTGSLKDKVTGIFSTKDILIVSVSLLGLIGAFILLAMAFKLAPKLTNMIRNAFGSSKGTQATEIKRLRK